MLFLFTQQILPFLYKYSLILIPHSIPPWSHSQTLILDRPYLGSVWFGLIPMSFSSQLTLPLELQVVPVPNVSSLVGIVALPQHCDSENEREGRRKDVLYNAILCVSISYKEQQHLWLA